MDNYKLKDITWMSKDSALLSLEPKNGNKKLDFYPGQYLSIGFRKFGRPSPVRCFSIVSSPNSHQLQVGIRVYGSFTKSLTKLKPGTNMFVMGPYGNFVIDEEQDKNIIMMAAGIGITPYMSMLRYLTEERIKLAVTLVYAARSTDNIPFYEELNDLQKKNPYLKITYLISGSIKTVGSQKFIKGQINKGIMDRITNNYYSKYTFFICGPKGFKEAVVAILADNNVDRSKIITEEFTPSTQLGSDPEGETINIPKVTYGLSFLALAFLSAFIMTIDLVRQVPKIQNTSQTSPANNSNTTTTSPVSNTSTNSQPAPMPSSNTTYSQPQQNQNTYTPPTTTVS